MKTRYENFASFYPFYLSQHANRTCRRLHFIGTTLGALCLLQAIESLNPLWIGLGLLIGYAFAWVGHFYFEKNRPATFIYPWYSFLGDWAMWKDILTRKIPY